MPLATGAAILRYRLYDLDRIISRTLAYGLLTLLLGGGYAVAVLGLGQLLGRGSSLVVAGATLAVAALFQPARRRVQAVVDRRFNRRRHDAARIIEGFGARLRDQVDLDTLTTDLLAVVDQTIQPTQASLWLRTPPEPSRTPQALWPRDDSVEPNGAPRWIDMTNTICRSYFASAASERRSPHCVALPARERYDRNGAVCRPTGSGEVGG